MPTGLRASSSRPGRRRFSSSPSPSARSGAAKRRAPEALAFLLLLLGAGTAAADDPDGGFWTRDTAAGDLGGVRPFLQDHGVTLSLADIEEGLGNPSGGMHRGGAYDGVTGFGIGADLDQLVGWEGAQFGFTFVEARGHGLSQHATANLLTVSNIETQPTTRIFDLYVDQTLADGAVSLRAGQMAAPDEFLSSHYAQTLLNGTFAWPAIAGIDLPGDDPVAVLATPGIRLRLTEGGLSWQAAVYEGAANALNGPPEARATESRGDGALVFTEFAYKIAPSAEGPLPAAYKLGLWYHTADFADVRYDRRGVPLAIDSEGEPRRHLGDWGAYLAVDRMLWHEPDTPDQGLGAFLRLATAPGDRNLVSAYADGGLVYKGLLPGRPADSLGLGAAWARIGGGARGYDQDTAHFYGIPYPVRDSESVVELSYQFAATPWWTLQPDLQWVVHPGGSIPNPETPASLATIPDAVVVGLRSTVRF
jgi:porin